MLNDLYNVAFKRDTVIIFEKSFNGTIDVQFGIYKDGKLTISLAPSEGDIDWKINFDFLKIKIRPEYASISSKVRLHRGFYREWMKNRNEFFNIIRTSPSLLEAVKKGLLIVGRSKGGSEAVIIGLDLLRNFNINGKDTYIGMIDAARTGNKYFCNSVEKYIPKSNLYWVRYGNDVVTQIPPFPFRYSNPGIRINLGPKALLFKLPLVDHALGCFKEEKLHVFAKIYDEKYQNSGLVKVRIKDKK